MPEQKAPYVTKCQCCEGTGLIDRTAHSAKTCPKCDGSGQQQEQKPIPFCPLRMISHGQIRPDCLKDECAWWIYTFIGDDPRCEGMCAIKLLAVQA